MNAHTRTNTVGPAEPDMEKVVIGAAMNSDGFYWKTCTKLRPKYFSAPLHAAIWGAIDDLAQDGRGFTALMIQNRLGMEIDGTQVRPFLATCQAMAEKEDIVDDYVEKVAEVYERRRLLELSEKVRKASIDPSSDTMAIIGDSLDELTEIAGVSANGEASFGELYRDVIDGASLAREGQVKDGIKTGIHALDDYLGMIGRDHLVEIGAQSNIGKTILAMQIAEYVSGYKAPDDPGVPVLFFPLDESAREIVARRVSAWSGIGADDMDRGHIDDFAYEMLRGGLDRAQAHKLRFSWGGGRRMTLKDIRARALSFKRVHGCGLVIIDHFKSIAPPTSRMMPIEAASLHAYGLKALKDELGCPVIFLNQITREAIKRDDQRPRRNDLWGGGDVTETPNTILLLHRPDQMPGWKEMRRNETRDDHDKRMNHEAGLAELIIDKARRRPRGSVDLTFHGGRAEFIDRTEEHGQQAMLGEW